LARAIVTVDSGSPSTVQILDHHGRPIELAMTAAQQKPATRRDLVRELGAGGPSTLAGTIVDDEEHNKKLRGIDGVRTFDIMRRTDAQVAAVLGATALPILSAERVVGRPEGDDEEAEKITDEHLDFAQQQCFERIDFDEVLQHITTAFWAGFAWFEKVYEVVDQQLMLSRVAPRMATTLWRWETGETGDLVGITQRVRIAGTTKDIFVPRNKLALFTVGKEAGDWGGRSILRPAFKSWSIKDVLYKLEAIRFERYAVGVPVITLPEPYTEEMMEMAKSITKNWKGASQSYVVMIGEMKVDIVSVGAGGAMDLQPAIRHHNEEIAKSVLAQFIDLGTSQSGSRALGTSMMEFFYDAIEGHAKAFASQWNREVLWPTMDLNFSDKPRPVLRFEDLGSVSLDMLGNSLAQLKDYVKWDADTENFLRQRLGLPQRVISDEEEGNSQRMREGALNPRTTQEDGSAADDLEEEGEEQPKKAPGKTLPFGGKAPVKPPVGKVKTGVPRGTHVHLAQEDPSKLSPMGLNFWRELRSPESFVRFRSIDAQLNDSRDQLVENLLELRQQVGAEIVTQVRDAWSGGPRAMARITLSVQSLARAAMAISPELEALIAFGRAQVEAELQRQAKSIGVQLAKKRGNTRSATIFREQLARVHRDEEMALPDGLPGALRLRDTGLTPDEASELTRYRSGELVTRLGRKTAEAAVALALDGWRTQGGTEPTGALLEQIMDAVFASVEREARLVASLTASEALNLGRDFEFRRFKDQIVTMQYSSLLDANTCFACRQADGFETDYGSASYYDLSPPLTSNRFGMCSGRGKCRCIFVAILRS